MTFKVGDPGGPGRPKKAIEIRFLQRLTCRVSEERWDKIVDAAIEAAEEGDAVARAWLGKHLMGEDPLALHSMMEELQEVRSELEALRVQRSAQGTQSMSSGDAGRASDSPPSDSS